MATASEMQKAYARGYWKGSQGVWPDHRPPAPPDEILACIFRAVKGLRDAADKICATISEDDEFATELAPRIDELDEAMSLYGQWVREK